MPVNRHDGAMTLDADTLVTGGTGFIGRWLVTSLTRRGRRVAVVARGGAARAAELAAFVSAHGGDPSRLAVIDGDLGRDDLGLTPAVGGVRDVFHLAAAFAFGLDAATARATNVGGTERIATWAAAQPGLRRFVHLGGYRATVLPPWLAGAGYPLPARLRARLYAGHGAYEASKLESYLAIRARAPGLPLTVVHPSTVIGAAATGEASQVTGLGETVARLWRGELPALVGTARTFVPLVTVDYLAELMATVPEHAASLGQELCVLDPSTPRLPLLMRAIAEHVGVTAPARLLPRALVARLPRALTGIDREALTFLVEDEYDTTAAEAHAAAIGLARPALRAATDRWATHLIATRFGEDPAATPGAFVSVAGSRSYVVGDPGSADALLLHGLPWNGDSMLALAGALGVTSARPDLPGLGRSSPATTSMPAWLDALTAGRAAPALVIGHSLAAGLALRHALAFPARVRGLVLISPAFLQRRAPWYARLAPLVGRVLRRLDAASLQRRLLGGGETIVPAVASARADLARRGVAARVAAALAVASQRRVRAELAAALAHVEVPVLIIHGDQDPLRSRPARGTVVTIPGGHNPHVASPAVVAEAIAAWQRRA